MKNQLDGHFPLEFFEHICHSISDVLILSDELDLICFASEGAKKILQVEFPSLIGIKISDIFIDFSQYKDTPELHNIDLEIKSGNKSICLIGSLTHLDFKKKKYHLINAQNFADTLKIEEEIKHQRSVNFEEIKLKKMRDISTQIAHEINNPLTSILGHLNMLERVIAEDKIDGKLVQERLQKLRTNFTRIQQAVQSKLFITKYTGEGPASLIQLKSVVEKLKLAYQDIVSIDSIDILIDQIDPKIKIATHEYLISQLLIILTENSIDAVLDCSTKWIKISATQSENGTLLLFQDSGKGFPKHIASQIFEPFYTSKKHGEAAGTGLAQARSIMQKLGGTIEYEPTETNTTFKIFFPKSLK